MSEKNIYVNQVGYYTKGTKRATLCGGSHFMLCNALTDEVVYEGELGESIADAASGDTVRIADFTSYETAGSYYLKNENEERSYRFQIKDNLYTDMQRDVLKAFYYQRCGCALEEKYAGVYHHDSCHTKPAAVLGEPEHFVDVRGGWHDAGDYGRYTTAAAVALAHMLYAYELFPKQWELKTGIPESGNGTPDILNECRYELDWMLRMQREDGGVYHKLTSFRHANFVLPHLDDKEFFLFPVSSLATADFAAVMALAARVYQNHDAAFAAQAKEAALHAWEWVREHPQFIFDHNPSGCNTGEYADDCDTDERAWAAAELFVLTEEQRYQQALKTYLSEIPAEKYSSLGWTEVTGLAGFALLSDKKQACDTKLRETFLEAFHAGCKQAVQLAKECGYGVALAETDYGWGSNMVVENRAMLLAFVNLFEHNSAYHETVTEQLDYLLGRNALGYSYVTGYGEHAFSHPHNRPTVALGDKHVMAGWVSGGANSVPCDEKAEWLIVPGTPPMKCYIDEWECYSLNEITIYWNSPVVFLTAYMQEINK